MQFCSKWQSIRLATEFSRAIQIEIAIFMTESEAENFSLWVFDHAECDGDVYFQIGDIDPSCTRALRQRLNMYVSEVHL